MIFFKYIFPCWADKILLLIAYRKVVVILSLTIVVSISIDVSQAAGLKILAVTSKECQL